MDGYIFFSIILAKYFPFLYNKEDASMHTNYEEEGIIYEDSDCERWFLLAEVSAH